MVLDDTSDSSRRGVLRTIAVSGSLLLAGTTSAAATTGTPESEDALANDEDARPDEGWAWESTDTDRVDPDEGWAWDTADTDHPDPDEGWAWESTDTGRVDPDEGWAW